ncbi:CusA/CzcA family heavy metal efflux RND transporter [Halovibrio salipaludis]|uniref:CusA/CzcA family heavy metal efflux RND transporter n=1 Tax=Halovibrio salipaludis TaxID=2032626 RepID=A0A2A2F7I9_9GAMM|nr:CusA/CzcA family heavy metal efflux RND transporter [Halovibrio salipaludis]PAU80694.1 CusA/CzcA family heavy metal efflux RND transporter [Halovibrio salipaludis]
MIERFIDLALRNRLLMVVFALMLLGGGIWSWERLGVEAVPDVSPKLVQVFTPTAGLAPTEVEKYVTYPVERAMTGLPNVREIRSVSNFGLSVVSIYFEDETDIYFARQVVGERLPKAKEAIPDGFGSPQMGPIATGQGLVLYYYLDAPRDEYNLTELRTIQDWVVKPQMETVKGVTEVLGIGGFQKQFQVNANANALQRYDLTLKDVIERVESNNLNVGAQYLEKNGEQFVIRSEGLAQSIEDLESITVKTHEGNPVHLRDVATIEIGGKVRQGMQTLNGEQEVVSGMVVKLYGTNTSGVIERVEKRLEKIQKSLPEGVRIVPYYEQKTLVQNSVDTVTNALLQGIGLVVAVLLVFMGGIRPSVVVATAIPFSVLFAVVGMYYFDISANLMSLGGLAIAIGLMVDGTIVMVENIDRHLRESSPEEPRIHVVGRACREVAQPILFAIAIIVIVFIPLFTLTGVEGKTFRPLAYTVALAMFGSLIYALFQTPVLSDLLMRRPRADKGDGESKESPLVRWILVPYLPMVRFFVRKRFAAVTLALVLLAAGAAIFPQLGSEFRPKLNEGDLIVNLTLAPSISLSEAKRQTMLAEKRILSVPGVKKTVSRIGRGEVGAHADPINSVHSLVVLEDRSQWSQYGYESQADIEEAIRKKLKGMPGIMTNMTQPIQLSVDELVGGVKSELAIKLYGDDLGILKDKADRIASVVREVPGAADVQAEQVTGAPQLRIRPDREALGRYGIDLQTVQHVIRNAVGGTTAGQVYDGVRRFDIYVRYQEQFRDDAESIGNILVEAPGGQEVPLSQLATIESIEGPRQISREDAQRYITVQANVVNRDMGGFVEAAKKQIDQQVEIPSGYRLDWGGQFELQQKANARFAVVIPITLALICLLLYMSFGSIRNTALILLNIPLALVGGIAALWLGGLNLSVPASVGFIALFGIALENGMVLVTYLNQLVRSGVPVDEASIRGAKLRVRPVLMTAVTSSLGLFPLLFATGTGSEVQRPLAAVVVGGLVTSTVLTLLVLPALYKWFSARVEVDEG